jgi:hypothetical protein
MSKSWEASICLSFDFLRSWVWNFSNSRFYLERGSERPLVAYPGSKPLRLWLAHRSPLDPAPCCEATVCLRSAPGKQQTVRLTLSYKYTRILLLGFFDACHCVKTAPCNQFSLLSSFSRPIVSWVRSQKPSAALPGGM